MSTNMFFMITTIITVVVLLFYIFWDVNYFIKLVFTMCIAKFQKKVGIYDITCIYGFCTTQDVDFFLNHMNNARYLRELDFTRIYYYARTGLYERCMKMNVKSLLGASNIRYRRPIPIFTVFKVESKLLYWEGSMIYMEHKFITPSDGFVRAVVLSRQNLVGTDARTLLHGLPGGDTEPTCPPDLHRWLQSIELSSEKLRTQAQKN